MTRYHKIRSFFEDFLKKSFTNRKNHSITDFFEIPVIFDGVKNE
jgi:hypothetical protein